MLPVSFGMLVSAQAHAAANIDHPDQEEADWMFRQMLIAPGNADQPLLIPFDIRSQRKFKDDRSVLNLVVSNGSGASLNYWVGGYLLIRMR